MQYSFNFNLTVKNIKSSALFQSSKNIARYKKKLNLAHHKFWLYDLNRNTFDFFSFHVLWPHQWQSGTALKAGRRKVPGSNPGRAFRPSRSEFSVVFFETCVNSYDSSERLPWRALPLQAQVSHADNCH